MRVIKLYKLFKKKKTIKKIQGQRFQFVLIFLNDSYANIIAYIVYDSDNVNKIKEP